MVELIRKNILDPRADIVALSAYHTLIAGGEISGFLHKAKGPEFEKASAPLGPLSPDQAIMTVAFNLNAKSVIHAVAPRYVSGTQLEVDTFRSTYREALKLGTDLINQSIVFLVIGADIYGWLPMLAATAAVEELKRSGYQRTLVCVIDEQNYDAYSKAVG